MLFNLFLPQIIIFSRCSFYFYRVISGRIIKKGNKFVITTPLLTDSSGRKIGKTEGNVIGLTDKPSELFAKIMALPDDIIVKGFECLTSISMEKLKDIEEDLNSDANPMDIKKKLAYQIANHLYGKEEAKKNTGRF